MLTLFAAPTVTTTTPTPGVGVTTLTSVAITFSESVTGVDAGDLLINGTASTAVSGSGAGPYSFTFTQPANGPVTVAWLAAHGITGTGGAFVAGASWQYYLGPPQIISTSPAIGSTLSALTSISVTFNQPVSGINSSDLEINSESAVSVTGSGAGPYVFGFTQPTPGLVAVAFDIDHGIAGLGTGPFAPSGGWTYTLTDTIAPSIGKIQTSVVGQEMNNVEPIAGATVSVLTRASVTFSELVTGVDAGDLLINGTPATSMTGDAAGPYVFNFTQPANGLVTFTWNGAHGIVDSVGNAFVPSGTWTVTLGTAIGSVIITEFLTENSIGLQDENLDWEGWIELFNNGATTVNLLGWALTDEPDTLGKWVFPSRTIAPGAYLVVYASGKDRKPASGNLHTNFKLNASGGYVALISPNSPRGAVSIFPSNYNPNPPTPVTEFPSQRYDYSYGIQSGGGTRYFSPPTPGSANPASTLTTVVPEPNASVRRGFFKEPFQVILTCTDPTATIRYTLNGSPPNGSSTAYTSPLNISNTTVLRMAAFSANAVPSLVVTHSYIFLDNVLNQPSPPYNDPVNLTDDANPALPTLSNIPGGTAFPVSWGSVTVNPPFPGLITNLNANVIPADYGMDPDVYNDATKYNDAGTVDTINGKTNLDRIKQGLRDLPILSVVMNNDEIFGPSGLYVYPQVTQKTPLIEKACSVELLLQDGTTGFSTTCGIRMHGNASRSPQNNPKHGFKLNFKGSYGASELGYALFPDSPVHEFDDLILRADYNSSWLHPDNGTQRPKGTRLRDAFCKHTFRDMGRVAGHHRMVHLFINGLYWGTYDPTEQENNGFAAAYLGGSKDDYDVYDQGILKSGTATAYTAMTAITSPIDSTKYELMKTYLDVPWFIDYMLLHFYLGHQDWGDAITKNWYAVRNNKTNGKFKYLPWDMENLMWSETVDRTAVLSPPSGLHTKLVTNAQYRLDFADLVHKHLVAPDGALLPAANIARWNLWQSIMTNAMACESARWGDYRRDVHGFSTAATGIYTWNGAFLTEANRLKNTYFPNRATNLTTPTVGVMPQLRNQALYPFLNAPEFRNNSTNALMGSQNVASGLQLKMVLPTTLPSGTTSTGTIYYTTNGADPRVYYDTTGQRTASAIAYTAPITLTSTTTVKARALNGTTWSALMEATFTVGSPLSKVVISEINYNPRNTQGGSAAEFVEIWNSGTTDVDLSRWSMDGIDFVYPVGLILSAGDRLVLANNESPSVFATQYPGVKVTGYFSGSLANSGERLSLLDQLGRIVFSVEYDNAAPWPTTPDNGGYSLELINPAGDPQSSCNWQASAVLKGTPGAANATAPASTIVINEFAAPDPDTFSNGGSETGFVELANVTNAPIDVSGWNIASTGGSVSLPASTVIAANGLLQIPWIYGTSLTPKVPAPSASTYGELTLTNAAVIRIDGVRYGPQAFGYSFGRNGNNWQLCAPTPGAVNSIATVAAQSSLKINEWLANPSSGEEDWLELKNLDATKPIVLTDLIVEKIGEPYRIAAPSAVAASSWVRLYANTGAKRADAILLQLPATGATLTLKTSVNTVIHTLNYTAQSTNVSQGLLPDGTGSTTTLGYPSPGAANHLALTNVPLLNEVLVLNRNGDNAPWAHRPAWVELKNPTASAINLSGWKLRVPNGASWKFPTGSSLAANGFLSVWADAGAPSSTTTSPHLNCALPLAQPGVVELVNPAGQIADRIAWGTQLVDQSIGRLPDNSWALLTAPTRGASNAAATSLAAVTSVKINEWLPLASSEFFEIYNPNASPVNLAGLWLGDEPSELGRKKWQVPALSFVGAQSFGVFGPTSSNASLVIPPQSIPFGLSATGEYIRLSQNDSTLTAIDAVNFGLITSGSAGRIPDGSATIQALNPSPGATNNTTPGPAILEHPMPAVVDLGGAATFSVRVLNPGIATYQWKRNGTAIAGEELETLTLPVTTLTDEADYTCTITDVSGTITSRSAHLTILYTYAAWAAAHGVASGTADDDADGLNNYAEFLANSDPLAPATAEERDEAFHFNGLEAGPGINFLSADFLLNRRASFNRLIGDLSPDLSLWNDAEPSSSTLLSTETNGDQHLRLKFTIPTNAGRMFLRMKLLP